MARIPIYGTNLFSEIDDCDLPSVENYTWRLSTNGYVYRRGVRALGEPSTVYLHRQLMGDPRIFSHRRGLDIHHVNGDRRDNRRLWNLRIAGRTLNLAATPPPITNRSGFKGVYFHKASGKWAATLTHRYVKHSLGLHTTREDAARAYNRKAKEVWQSFAWLNPVD